MKTNKYNRTAGMICVSIFTAYWLATSGTALAHCDTEKGPVIQEARAALEKGDVTPILKWIKKDRETEIKKAFATAQVVRDKGPEAKELADRQFVETLVRLHRAGEGAPYTGIKDEPIDPAIAMADMALEKGKTDELLQKISNDMVSALKKKFERAVETSKHKDDSIEAGRRFVEAYVDYMHYVENVHAAITGKQPDHAAPETKDDGTHSHMH